MFPCTGPGSLVGKSQIKGRPALAAAAGIVGNSIVWLRVTRPQRPEVAKRATEALETRSLDDPRKRVAESSRWESFERTIMRSRVIDDVPAIDRAGTNALARLSAMYARMASADIPGEVGGKSHGK